MKSTAGPSIIFIPGSFAFPQLYDPVFDIVRGKGHEIRGLHLPSVGLPSGQPRPGQPPSMYDDAAHIAAEVQKLVDEGRNVILVTHSYGAVPACQSTKELSRGEREQAGKPGGIVNIAFMTSLVPAVGQTAKDVLATVPPEAQVGLKADEDGWMRHDPPERSAKLTFSDLPFEEGITWVKRLTLHSAPSFMNELTYAGYKDVDVSYLLCEKDLVVPLHIQKAGIEMIERDMGKKVDVSSIPRDHCPMVHYPDEIAEWIVKVAGKYPQ